MAARFTVGIIVVSSVFAFDTHQAQSQSLETMQLATNLGTVIAAETYCGLTYDQAGVAAYIEQNVKPGDMSFPSTLQTMIAGSKFQHQGMSPSAKTAHCAQIKRIAATYNFIK